MYKSICPLFYYRLSYIKLVIVIIFKLYSLDNINQRDIFQHVPITSRKPVKPDSKGVPGFFAFGGKFPYLGESRRILMAVSSKTSSKTRFYYAATRRISSAAVQPSIWA